jgi:glucose-1-phosphate thymidylyltransferase
MFTAGIWPAVKAIRPSARGELEITDAIQEMVERGQRVEPHVVTGWWKDTGRLEDMLEANRLVLDRLEPTVAAELGEGAVVEGRVSIARGAVLERCLVRGPVVIGERATIRDAFVGPYTSISDDAVVERAEVEHSIIMERSQVLRLDARLVDSLVGRDAVITRTERKPRAYRFLVGDESRIGIP